MKCVYAYIGYLLIKLCNHFLFSPTRTLEKGSDAQLYARCTGNTKSSVQFFKMESHAFSDLEVNNSAAVYQLSVLNSASLLIRRQCI